MSFPLPDHPLLSSPHPFWLFITRFGEAQIMLPALAVVLLWFGFKPEGRRVAITWLACLAAATLLTTTTKVAFIGWGLGWAPLDFTGISGHSMFSAAVLPLLLVTTVARRPAGTRWSAWGVGCVLAALIALSRVRTGSHSVSEAIAGFLIGTLSSGGALCLAAAPPLRLPRRLLAGIAACLALLLLATPTAPTHALVTRLALAMSGHPHPHTRAEMLYRYRLAQRHVGAP